jgi:glycosyltransferase 2 family protein
LPAIGGLLALAGLAYLYRGMDLAAFWQGLKSANSGWIAVLGVTILLEQFLGGWKWRQILYDLKPISSLRLTSALLAGYGANALVPLGISPLVRSWLVARLDGLKMGTVLTTTIIARFIDGAVFALFAGLVAMLGRIPQVEGNLKLGLAIAGGLNLLLFGGLLWGLFRFRAVFALDGPLICRLFDRAARLVRANGRGLRLSLCEGVIWPKSRWRRSGTILAAVASKAVAATHFVWAGLAIGVVLAPMDYLFLMVFAGFSMVLSRFVRIPGGFVIGAGFALGALGVAPEQALLMTLFSFVTSMLLVVGLGLVILWRSGLDIRQARKSGEIAHVQR